MDRHDFYSELARHTDNQANFYKALRGLPVDVVGDIMLNAPNAFPEIVSNLPTMAPEEVQKNWNGSAGYNLLLDSCAYIRTLESGINRFSGKSMDNARILDFGCGWGRLIRLLYKFTAPENIYGCDPWEKSLDLCRQSGIRANLAKSDYLPLDLPFPGVRFDVIIAYSVFTHLSEKAALAAINACRKHIADDGMLVITVRPKSYWEAHSLQQNPFVDKHTMIRNHETDGFAFTPHGAGTPAQVDGEITYGDTSISLQYIEREWTHWEVAGTEHFLQDPLQRLVFLKPRL